METADHQKKTLKRSCCEKGTKNVHKCEKRRGIYIFTSDRFACAAAI